MFLSPASDILCDIVHTAVVLILNITALLRIDDALFFSHFAEMKIRANLKLAVLLLLLLLLLLFPLLQSENVIFLEEQITLLKK